MNKPRSDAQVVQLGELFPGADVVGIVRREPVLLTYDVPSTLAAKVEVYERALPQVEVLRLLASTPRLLTYDAARVLPEKLAALERLFPGISVPRLVKSVPQLLEYDIDGSIAPKVQALRSIFHPSAAAPPPGPVRRRDREPGGSVRPRAHLGRATDGPAGLAQGGSEPRGEVA